jgi:phenylpropionate dioxygenase-like ring-hydroxylating dioxygenase large terminal subunit
MGEKLVFWRDRGGQVQVLRDKCAHRGVALSAGAVKHDCVECPFHGFQYDSTGRCRLIPANGQGAKVPERFRVPGYPVREVHDFIWIWWGEPRDELPEPRFFEDIGPKMSFSSFRDPWPVHYSRAVENQLDVMHLPFVHHNTIGKGGRTLVDGPLVEWLDEDRLRFHVFNRVDDGTPSRKPEELEAGDAQVYLDFLFPNIWQNFLSDKMRIVAAFAPVDEENTMVYIRAYQGFLTLPGLAQLVDSIFKPFNRLILSQDKRVVITQQPKKTWLRMGENLVQGDRPIVEYRTRRQELIDEAKA